MRLLLLLTVLFIAGCNSSKTTEQLISEAKTAMANRDYKVAIIILKNSVAQTPDSIDSRYLLGKSYLLTGQFSGANKELARAYELGGDSNVIFPLLIRTKLHLADFDAIDTYLQNDWLKPQTLMELNYLAGIGLTMMGQATRGILLVNNVLALEQSDNFYFQLSKAFIAAKNDQLEEAIALTALLSKNDNEFNDGLLLNANLNALATHNQLALANYERYINAHGYNLFARVGYISLLVKMKDLDKAEWQVDALLKNNPTSPILSVQKAEISFLQQNYEQAADYANTAILTMPHSYRANLIAGLSHHQIKNSELAYHHLIQIKDVMPKGHIGSQILDSLRLSLGYTEEVLTDIDAKTNITEDDFNLLSSASFVLMREGNKARAREYINRLELVEVESPRSLSQRGLLKLAINDESGLKDLEQAITVSPEFALARIALLNNHLDNNNFEQAMSVANEWIVARPDADGGYLAQGLVWQRKNNDEQAKISFNLALAKNPDSTGGKFNLALYDILEEKFQAAYVKLAEILAKSPNHRGALDRMAGISMRIEDQQTVPAFFTQLLEQSPENIDLVVALAKSYENLQDREKGLATLARAKVAADKNVFYLVTYADMNLRARHFDKAEELFAKLLETSPKHQHALLGLIFSYEAQKKYQLALKHVKKAQQLFPQNKNYRLFEVNFLLMLDEIENAEQTLTAVNSQQVSRPLYLALKMALHLAKNEYELANEYAQERHQLAPNNQNALRYALILHRLKQNQLAEKVVTSAIEQNGSHPALETLLAELNIEMNPEKSFTIYQNMAKQQPDDFVVLNNLAWSAIMTNKYELSLAYAQKAEKIAPEMPQVLDTLAVALMRNGKYQEAEKLLIKVTQALPDDTDVSMHYAEVLIHLNKLSESKLVLANIEESPKKQKILDLLANING
ncbi:hypothetical protein A9Q98_15115 [Thalassotalea sp. 42_200_T64]|nr:hypothetical protein A9Q98_15115 [Thalassotalea sp. 42_200_T64]